MNRREYMKWLQMDLEAVDEATGRKFFKSLPIILTKV